MAAFSIKKIKISASINNLKLITVKYLPEEIATKQIFYTLNSNRSNHNKTTHNSQKLKTQQHQMTDLCQQKWKEQQRCFKAENKFSTQHTGAK